jgi:hypothetical protein
VKRKPSPSLVISIIALVMASTGTAVAAVNFAKNAGRVDGKSAVSARSSLRHAAGKLVATKRGGSERGKIPVKFIGGGVTTARSFFRGTAVVDNQAGAALDLGFAAGGKLTASCRDQNNKAGNENPSTTITFSNLSTSAVNSARTIGGDDAAVGVLAPGGTSQFKIDGSNTFSYHLERAGKNVLIDGVVRQTGVGTADGACVVYGTTAVIG